jgi:hypothetical protein
MAALRYPFTQDALDAARAALAAEDGTMEDAIRTWLREAGFGLEANGEQMRLVGPWLDT